MENYEYTFDVKHNIIKKIYYDEEKNYKVESMAPFKIVEELENLREENACLEAKLAESEADKRALICDYEIRITKEQELMSWLEHKNEELKQQLAEKDEDLLALDTENYSFKQQIDNLKQKLEDKEKEIESYEHELEVYKQNDNVYARNMNRLANRHNQDKISFAVEQLEQLRHDVWTNQQDDGYTDMQVDLYDLNDTIDVRIMKLKEGK